MNNQIFTHEILLIDSDEQIYIWLQELLGPIVVVRKITASKVSQVLEHKAHKKAITFFLIKNTATEKYVFDFMLDQVVAQNSLRYLLVLEKANLTFVKNCLRFEFVNIIMLNEFEQDAHLFIHRTIQSELNLSPKLILALFKDYKQPLHELQMLQKLTPREKEVLSLIAQGLSNAEIKNILGIAENTVKSLTYKLYQKLNVKNRVEALRKFWNIR